MPRPRVRPFLDAGGYGTPAPPATPSSSGGPRQEYLDAFDEQREDVFAAGAPGRKSPAPSAGSAAAPPGPPPPRAAEPAPMGPRPPRPRDEPGAPVEEEPGPLAPIAPPPQRSSSRGRTVTGIAAAAVTAVLAVTVAGQVAEDDAAGSGRDQAGLGQRDGAQDDTTRSEQRAAGTEKTGGSRNGRPATYAKKMATAFPLSADFAGKGSFETVGGHQKGPGGASVLRYRVDVEKGLPLDGELFANAVHKTLNDERSWAHGGERSFERVSSSEDADFVVTLASPRTTDVWCAKSGLDTSEQKVSCDSAATERVMINAYRWAQGAKTYGDEHLWAYRQMLINHEVGHRLGHGHVGCSRDGALAPVMMQQTKFLSTDGATCRPNAWPHPKG